MTFVNIAPRARLPRGSERVSDYGLAAWAKFIQEAQTNPNMTDFRSGINLAYAGAGGGVVTKAYDSGARRAGLLVGGTGLGGWPTTIVTPYSIPAGAAGYPESDRVVIVGGQMRVTSTNNFAAAADCGLFLKSSSGTVATVLTNSVRYGVIPARERAFGFNYATAAQGWEFVAIDGATGARVITPLGITGADVTLPFAWEIRILQPTAENPTTTLQVWINGAEVFRSPMSLGNAYGLPYSNPATAERCLLPVFTSPGAGIAGVPVLYVYDYYVRTGPTVEGVA